MTIQPEVAILICSSDSRIDIFQRLFPSVLKFWANCPYRIYVGLNSDLQMPAGVSTLIAPKSTWRTESLEQVRQLSESHLLVILDDFLFEAPVNQTRLSMLVAEAVSKDLPYLRLLPLGLPLFARLLTYFRRQDEKNLESIRQSRPFHSSLQIAIWNRQYFIDMLMQKGSIWDFEHQVRPGFRHYAVTGDPPIVYRHLVEKGRWLPFAAARLRAAGLPAELGIRPKWGYLRYFKLLMDEVRFFLLGYAIH